MGVKDLWSVLSPISRPVSLSELEGKKIAIDLSCWVCEGQYVGDKVSTQPRMYLRNLFFRTQTLLMMNIVPIFVLDGEAPELKLDTMKQRTMGRFGNRAGKSNEGETSTRLNKLRQRSHFKGLVKQCKILLQMMGVTCLQSDGEAEALCAQLDNCGIVDGVITQDSDVFLYGARTVYRNFSIKSGSGTADKYLISDIEDRLNLTRDKLIAMSLLCGCDYDLAGVHGIGKELAYKYVMDVEDDVLERLRILRTDKDLARYEEEKNNCTKCCHIGKASEHRKNGCNRCGMIKGCCEELSSTAFKNFTDEKKKIVNLELSIRKKVLDNPQFPCEKTIHEFLHTFQDVPTTFNPKWLMPNVVRFSNFCNNMLEWELDYAFDKIVPLLTRWQLLHGDFSLDMQLLPAEIIKKRVTKGVDSLDIKWQVCDENVTGFMALLTEDCTSVKDGFCITTEPKVIVLQKMPELSTEFFEAIDSMKNKNKKVGKKPKKKTNLDVPDELLDGLQSMSLSALPDGVTVPQKTKSKQLPKTNSSGNISHSSTEPPLSTLDNRCPVVKKNPVSTSSTSNSKAIPKKAKSTKLEKQKSGFRVLDDLLNGIETMPSTTNKCVKQRALKETSFEIECMQANPANPQTIIINDDSSPLRCENAIGNAQTCRKSLCENLNVSNACDSGLSTPVEPDFMSLTNGGTRDFLTKTLSDKLTLHTSSPFAATSDNHIFDYDVSVISCTPTRGSIDRNNSTESAEILLASSLQDLSGCDSESDSTLEYDISQIVNDIVSRKRF